MKNRSNINFQVNKNNNIHGLIELVPSISDDLRGNIWSSFVSKDIDSFLPDNLNFHHDKFSLSKQNVLRGIHGDNKSWKLVTCVYGEVFQVVVDLREDSISYKSWQGFDISKDKQSIIMIPPGCGNAYYVKSNEAVYHYKLAYHGEYIDYKDQFTFAWDDSDLNIDWPCTNPILSGRDSK